MSLPPGWAETTLGDVGRWGSGGTPKASVSQYFGGDVPWIRSGDLPDGYVIDHPATISEEGLRNSSAKWVAPGAILIAMYGATIGKLGITTIRTTTNQAVAFLEPFPEFDVRFLFASLRQRKPELVALGQGGAQPNISQDILKAQRIAVPPAAEQRRIVAKLDALTARLARAREEAEHSQNGREPLERSLLRSAVTGVLTEDWREVMGCAETVPDMLARVAAPAQGRGGREATDKVIPGAAGLSVNDPGSPLPDGWAWTSLLRVAKQETGHTPSRSKPDYWDGGVPWIGIRDAGAHHGRVIQDTAQTISEEGLANSSARLLPTGTVCLSRTASVGYVTMLGRSMATSQDFATWTCTEALLPEYLMFALMAEGDDIRRFGMGSTHTTIYFPEVRAFHIALPPIVEQREIVRRVQASLARACRLEAEAKKALALIDRLEAAILAKAFRGELVPQDPNDEPASVLLERIRARRAAEPKAKRGRRPKLVEAADA